MMIIAFSFLMLISLETKDTTFIVMALMLAAIDVGRAYVSSLNELNKKDKKDKKDEK